MITLINEVVFYENQFCQNCSFAFDHIFEQIYNFVIIDQIKNFSIISRYKCRGVRNDLFTMIA